MTCPGAGAFWNCWAGCYIEIGFALYAVVNRIRWYALPIRLPNDGDTCIDCVMWPMTMAVCSYCFHAEENWFCPYATVARTELKC